ncbi:MAG: DUF255 domain-containing protein [Bacteroidia bacterium]
MKKIFFCAVLLSCIAFVSESFVTKTATPSPEKIHWYTFEEAAKLDKEHPKKIFIDVQTSWCVWCKRMEATTYEDTTIIRDLNTYFYPVKLDAEMTDTVRFDTLTFVNPHPGARGSVHQLAYSLLGGKMSYPTTVYMDERFTLLSRAPGYLDAKSLEPILMYFAGNNYKNTKWEDYKNSFKGNVK